MPEVWGSRVAVSDLEHLRPVSIHAPHNASRTIQPTMTTAATIPQAENIAPHSIHQEIALPLPRALHTTAHIHLTFEATYTMVFLSTTLPGDSGEKPLGSFVYAMPDVRCSTFTYFH